MPATVQLNTRIDPVLKQRGDAVFARAGLTSSEVVRAVWETAARTQEVPECVLPKKPDEELEKKLAAAREGYGLARRMAEEMGIHLSDGPIDYKALRAEMYDEMIDQMERTHV